MWACGWLREGLNNRGGEPFTGDGNASQGLGCGGAFCERSGFWSRWGLRVDVGERQ